MFATAVRARSASRAQLAAWEANSRKLHPSEGIDGRPFASHRDRGVSLVTADYLTDCVRLYEVLAENVVADHGCGSRSTIHRTRSPWRSRRKSH